MKTHVMLQWANSFDSKGFAHKWHGGRPCKVFAEGAYSNIERLLLCGLVGYTSHMNHIRQPYEGMSGTHSKPQARSNCTAECLAEHSLASMHSWKDTHDKDRATHCIGPKRQDKVMFSFMRPTVVPQTGPGRPLCYTLWSTFITHTRQLEGDIRPKAVIHQCLKKRLWMEIVVVMKTSINLIVLKTGPVSRHWKVECFVPWW